MSQDRIWCGSGKKKEFQNGGSITSVSLDIDTLINNFDEHGFTTRNGKRVIKIKVSSKRDGEDQYGNTHNVEIDTWKPDNQNSGNNNYNNSGGNKSNNYQGFNGGGNNSPSYENYPSGNQGGGGNFEDDIPF